MSVDAIKIEFTYVFIQQPFLRLVSVFSARNAELIELQPLSSQKCHQIRKRNNHLNSQHFCSHSKETDFLNFILKMSKRKCFQTSVGQEAGEKPQVLVLFSSFIEILLTYISLMCTMCYMYFIYIYIYIYIQQMMAKIMLVSISIPTHNYPFLVW